MRAIGLYIVSQRYSAGEPEKIWRFRILRPRHTYRVTFTNLVPTTAPTPAAGNGRRRFGVDFHDSRDTLWGESVDYTYN